MMTKYLVEPFRGIRARQRDSVPVDKENSSQGKDFHFPKGIDVYFENVGGNMLDKVLLHMNLYGRIAVSGMISQYNLKKPDGIHNLFCLISKRLRMEGFSEFDFRHKVPEYLEFAIQLIREKKLLFVEDIAEGLENAASAFVGIYHGRNVGKQIIQVSTD
ncbi:hypothetical protein KY284_002078 [Solanum tuberosum]|nr:hypothetical protein KY284_002078 [Solanum tuberosum]